MVKRHRIKILDQGKCDFVRNRGKEAYVKSTSLRTETFYKAGVVGELAPTQYNPRFNRAGKECPATIKNSDTQNGFNFRSVKTAMHRTILSAKDLHLKEDHESCISTA